MESSADASMDNRAIVSTKAWLEEVIVGLNFCPFAKKELVNDTIHYHVCSDTKLSAVIDDFVEQCHYLEKNPEIETSLLIYDKGFLQFERYLDLLDAANDKLYQLGYEGDFQLASFHPDYCFEGENYEDAANYTNRSPWPTLHLIRESSIEKVLKTYKSPEDIPVNNIELARVKGNDYFANLLKNINQN